MNIYKKPVTFHDIILIQYIVIEQQNDIRLYESYNIHYT